MVGASNLRTKKNGTVMGDEMFLGLVKSSQVGSRTELHLI